MSNVFMSFPDMSRKQGFAAIGRSPGFMRMVRLVVWGRPSTKASEGRERGVSRMIQVCRPAISPRVVQGGFLFDTFVPCPFLPPPPHQGLEGRT